MVVDKDVEGMSEWTLGEVKTEWVHTLTVLLFRWKDQSRGYVCRWEAQVEGMSGRLTNFLCTGRIMIGAGLSPVGLPQCLWQLPLWSCSFMFVSLNSPFTSCEALPQCGHLPAQLEARLFHHPQHGSFANCECRCARDRRMTKGLPPDPPTFFLPNLFLSQRCSFCSRGCNTKSKREI